mgnify:CR=1 FL=1
MKAFVKAGVALSLAALMTTGPMAVAAEDDYPNRPIRIVVGFAPGGGGDTVARIMADSLSKTLKQPVLVENRPGAFTTIAPTVVANAAPDGYTLLLAPDSVFGPDKALYPKTVSYDENSFTPISKWASTFFVLAVNANYEPRTVAELLDKARKALPQQTFVASTQGIYPQLILEKIHQMTGVKFSQIPYKGGAPAVVAVVSGEPPITFAVPSSVMPLVKDGRLRALAITAAERSPLTPGLPTMSEEGLPGFQVGYWFGLAGPAGLPRNVVDKLFEASKIALSDPQVREKLAQIGYDTTPSTSVEEFQAEALRDGNALRKAILDMGLTVE